MTFLLDTHAWLWFLLDDPQLTERARLQIENPANRLLLSPASVWEIAIKISIGKYHIDHAAKVATLPFHHRDPFDRLLIAQALIEQAPIISADDALDPYSVVRLW